MANSNKPFGFRRVGSLSGAPISGGVQKFYTNDSTAFYVGDTVMSEGTTGQVYADDCLRPTVVKASNASVVLGVVEGFEPLPASPTLRYHTSSTAQYVLVSVDPNAIYEVQGDSTVWTADDIGTNAAITVSTGSTTTGQSNAVITSPSESATASVLIIGQVPDPSNVMGAYCRFLVKMNLNQYANAALGIE
jgi:hypothetical protein